MHIFAPAAGFDAKIFHFNIVTAILVDPPNGGIVIKHKKTMTLWGTQRSHLHSLYFRFLRWCTVLQSVAKLAGRAPLKQ